MVESKSFGSRLFDVLNYALLFVLTVVFLYPLWYVLVGSISDPVRLFMHNGLLWRPLGFSLHGYDVADVIHRGGRYCVGDFEDYKGCVIN